MFIFLFLCQIISLRGKASGKPMITLVGFVLSDNGAPISGCYIKLTHESDGRVICFLNTGQDNNFKISFQSSLPDTFLITITHLNYKNTVERIIVTEDRELRMSFTLHKSINELPGVTITAPPVWIRGDTTFFRTDFYKDGSERKLKDVISKIPGFTIDNEGNLFYKNQKVEKILVEGEELFSDKLWMMLNSFPSHVLQNIQIIENQSSNRLLKGISGERKVFLNLGLKKKKLKAAFGDGEAGVGTQSRYYLNPVLFSLLGKIKTGLIADWNNSAEEIEDKHNNDLKNEAIKMSQKWMINSNALQFINEISTNKYIKDLRREVRMQINYPLGKVVRAKTEFNFLNGRQVQVSAYNSFLLSNNYFFQRKDSNYMVFKPTEDQMKQTFTWSVRKNTELETTLSLYRNEDHFLRNSIFIQEDSTSSIHNFLHNNWQNFEVKGELTSRLSEKKALHFLSVVDKQNLHQGVDNFSDSWNKIFNLTDQDYNLEKLSISNSDLQIKSELGYLVKTKTGLLNTSLNSNFINLNVQNETFVEDTGIANKKVMLSNFSNGGSYQYHSIYSKSQKTFQLLKKEPLMLAVKFGFYNYLINEAIKQKLSGTVYDISLIQRFRLDKKLTSGIMASFYQQPFDSYWYKTITWPVSFTAFQEVLASKNHLRSLNFNSGLYYDLPQQRISSNIFFMFSHSFTSIASSSYFKDFVQIEQDSVVHKPLNSISIFSTSTVPSIFFKALFDFGAGININEYYFRSQTKLLRGNLIFYNYWLNVKKNFNKRYYLVLQTKYITTINKTPKEISNYFDNKIVKLVSSLNQRIVVKKNLSFSINTQLFSNNLNNHNESSLLFIDWESRFRFANKPFSFFFHAYNLANEKVYNSTNNYALSQMNFSLPLIKRSFIIGMRYEL